MSRKKSRQYHKRLLEKRRKAVFLLPNLVTAASLFSGFYALVMATDNHFLEAGVAILVSLVLDGLDGKLARLTSSATSFGVQFDSLADLVAFGVAPAYLIFSWALTSLDRLGWIAAFVFVCCGALRLARFNVQCTWRDPRFFCGLPIPAAAATLAGLVISFDRLGLKPADFQSGILVLMYVLSFLMVSNLPYRSLKYLDPARFRSLNYLVGAILLLSVVAYQPYPTSLVLLGIYLFSGPGVGVYRLIGKRGQKPLPEEPQEAPAGQLPS